MTHLSNQTKDIHCNECNRFLFSTSTEAWGAIGCEAQNKGFIFKIPILFTDKYERLFFCCKECQKSFYDKNIPKNEEISKTLSDMKSQIPEMAKQVSSKMAELVDLVVSKPINYTVSHRLTYKLLNWGAFCRQWEKLLVDLDKLYSDFEKDFNPEKGETQKGEFDKWIEKFKSGKFFCTERSFDIDIDQASKSIYFTRKK